MPGHSIRKAFQTPRKPLALMRYALVTSPIRLSLSSLQLQAIHDNLPAHPTTFLVKGTAGEKWEVGPISKYKTFFDGVPAGSVRFFILSSPYCHQTSSAYNWFHGSIFLSSIAWLAAPEHPGIPLPPLPRNKIACDPLLEGHHPPKLILVAFSLWYFPSRSQVRARKTTYGCGMGTNSTEQTCTSHG
jgi:hypothetical protein